MATELVDSRITTRRVSYGNGLQAFVAHPNTPGPHPAVILLHERYGPVAHNLDLAQRFARDGYLCLAPNLYSRVPDQGPLQRAEVYLRLPDDEVLADMNATIDYLKNEPADLRRVAIMGVCISGRWALLPAAARTDVGAVLLYYGGAYPNGWVLDEYHHELVDDIVARVQCPILGIFGENDHVIPIEYVRRFRDALETHRKSYQIRLFPRVPHGWLNDTMPERFFPQEAAEAWATMHAFMRRVWGGGYPADRVLWQFEANSAIDYDHSKAVRMG